jgi:hypothetical protein
MISPLLGESGSTIHGRGEEGDMASSGVLARVGLVFAVSVILGISTLSPLLKPASDFGAPVSGPPLYQTAAAPLLGPAEQKPAGVEARGNPAKVASTALLSFPPRPVAERPAPASATTAVAIPTAAPQQHPVAAAPLPPPSQQQAAATAEEPAPPPVVAESEAAPKPEKRAAAPKRPKKPRVQQPPIYTRNVQMQPL